MSGYDKLEAALEQRQNKQIEAVNEKSSEAQFVEQFLHWLRSDIAPIVEEVKTRLTKYGHGLTYHIFEDRQGMTVSISIDNPVGNVFAEEHGPEFTVAGFPEVWRVGGRKYIKTIGWVDYSQVAFDADATAAIEAELVRYAVELLEA